MRACWSPITPACRRARRSSWPRPCSMRFRWCSGGSAACCGRPFRGAISKLEGIFARETRMIPRPHMLVLAAALSLAASAAATAQDNADDKIKAMATFSILGDLVANVGGDRLEVATLVGPSGDAHVYEPSPADAKRL